MVRHWEGGARSTSKPRKHQSKREEPLKKRKNRPRTELATQGVKKNREQRSLPTTPSVTKKHPALPILKKVGDPTLEVLADYFPLGCSARKCYKVSSQAGKRLTFYQVAEWSNSLFGVVGRTSHGFDSGPVHFLWFLIRKEQKKRPVRERRKTPSHVKILAEKASGPTDLEESR